MGTDQRSTAAPVAERLRERVRDSLPSPLARGREHREFQCCDATFHVHVEGWGRTGALAAAEETARTLEARLDAFDEGSPVSRLNRTGRVADEHVAAVVRRGLEYRERTDGAFDVTHGAFEHALKDYLRGERDSPPDALQSGDVSVSGETVTADAPLDLNGLAKGYVVDRATEALAGPGRRGFVDGGGDIASPTGPVAIESPYGEDAPLERLDTRWNVATSGGYRRRRDGVDHLYDPRTGRPGGRHDVVTVLAERDCTEADALATTVATLPVDDALALIDGWEGAEAFLVHAGVFHHSAGFPDHVA